MSGFPIPSTPAPAPRRPLDDRVVQWFAAELIRDSAARLIEGGGGTDAKIELATVFVDLPSLGVFDQGHRHAQISVVQTLCSKRLGRGDAVPDHAELQLATLPSAVIIGGPGSGKTTATTMIAQLLRLETVRPDIDRLPEPVRARVRPIAQSLDELGRRIGITTYTDLVPLRVNLPELARWLAGDHPPSDGPSASAQALWRFLAHQASAAYHLAVPLAAGALAMLASEPRSVLWLFDGLDEVPRSAGRDRVVAIVRAAAQGGVAQHVVMTTRPQGYEGELGELDALVLAALPAERALDYGTRLLRAWRTSDDPELPTMQRSLEDELAKPEIQALVASPLHATIATLLIAGEGRLPSARHLLFESYFETIFKRELRKRGDHGIRHEDRARLMKLHARAGLVLHTRSQVQAGARPLLSPRELRLTLQAILIEEQVPVDEAAARAERMLRFAAERLVLLLRTTEGGYELSIRSLQEFFAGQALLEGAPDAVRRRLESIALQPHWSNVLGLVVSCLAIRSSDAMTRASTLQLTVELCRALNAGTIGGRPAAECIAGSRLALTMLRETERYGSPWLHGPLWDIAFAAAAAPLQPRGSAALRLGSESAWSDDLEIHLRLAQTVALWAGGQRTALVERTLVAARARLAEGASRAGLGWRLLLPLVTHAEAESAATANALAPRSAADAEPLLEAFSDYAPAIQTSWLQRVVDDHPAWWRPDKLLDSIHSAPRSELASGLLTILRLAQRASDTQIIVSTPGGVGFRLWPLDAAAEIWSQVRLPAPGTTAEWDAWRKLAAFHGAPSSAGLADALDAVAASGQLHWLARRPICLAWPARACLEFAVDGAMLRSTAAALRTGRLGDVPDWRAAELRWRATPMLTEDEFERWLFSDDLPWSQDIVASGRVIELQLLEFLGFALSGVYRAELDRVAALVQAHGSLSTRSRAMLDLLLIYGAFSVQPMEARPPLPIELLGRLASDNDPRYRYSSAVATTLPDLTALEPGVADKWYELLDARGRQASSWALRSPFLHLALDGNLATLIARLAAHPEQWGLIDAIWALLCTLPDHDLGNLQLPALPSDAPAHVHASAAALTLVAAADVGADTHAHLAAITSTANNVDLRSQLANILGQRRRSSAHSVRVLLDLLDASRDDAESASVVSHVLFYRLAHASPPAFVSAEAWRDLQLADPYFSGQLPAPRPPRILELATLTNLRLFKDTPEVDAPFPGPDPDQGQWIVLVGENGVGKTTLLRALGLALSAPTVAPRLLDDSQPWLRNGGAGCIAVELDTGRAEIEIRRDARTETIVATPADRATRPWVVGYGVRRGNARGEKDRAHEWGPTGELHTLFDRPANLVNAVDWLLDLDRRVLNEQRQLGADRPDGGDDRMPRYAAIWRAVTRALAEMLQVAAVEPDDQHVFVTHPSWGRVRLDALSDGYLTTTGWVIDLIARWIRRQDELEEVVGPDLLRQMTGFVLIDEIDLHLHPIWQMRVIDDARRIFPRLSFVVTTHNPLTLHGARPGEIFVMRRGEASRVELTQRDIRPGHDVDRVLFEQFEIASSFDRGTRELLDRHRALLAQARTASDPERLGLERELAARLGSVGEVLTAERSSAQDATRPWSQDQRRKLDKYRKRDLP
jgi:energy-coupling factor transporter ATP-binding protein EcfA2